MGNHAGSRGPLFRRMPSVALLVGIAALTASAGGTIAATDTTPTSAEQHSVVLSVRANALSGTSDVAHSGARDERREAVSRDLERDALEDVSDRRLEKVAEAQAKRRNATLAQLAQSAEAQAAEIELNQWVLPLSSYDITATFGASSGLWTTTHTGLDMSAPSGTPVKAVANGTVTEVGYDGSYGNQIVQTLDDGTELWYCHLTSYDVGSGETVRAGDVIGSVGSTGNSTGPHLHLEVRPGAGDPVDPYAALVSHGLSP